MDVVPIVNGASTVAQARKAPMPKSPFVYPDLCGRHRLQVEVQMMDREIGFLEVISSSRDKCEEKRSPFWGIFSKNLEKNVFIVFFFPFGGPSTCSCVLLLLIYLHYLPFYDSWAFGSFGVEPLLVVMFFQQKKEELNSLNELQPASKCCEEVNVSVESKPDPLLPLNQKTPRSTCLCRCINGILCLNLSCLCCFRKCTPECRKPKCRGCCNDLCCSYDQTKCSCCKSCCSFPRFSCSGYSCGCILSCRNCKDSCFCPRCSDPCCMCRCLCP